MSNNNSDDEQVGKSTLVSQTQEDNPFADSEDEEEDNHQDEKKMPT